MAPARRGARVGGAGSRPAAGPGGVGAPHRSDRSGGGLVYSTDAGRMCPGCRRPIAQCGCHVAAPLSAGDGVVRVGCEREGRGGKVVTLVRGLALEAAALDALARRLRAVCGAGGGVHDGVVEVQGDHRERVAALLVGEGWKVKPTGG